MFLEHSQQDIIKKREKKYLMIPNTQISLFNQDQLDSLRTAPDGR
jgi:hypothetical protein